MANWRLMSEQGWRCWRWKKGNYTRTIATAYSRTVLLPRRRRWRAQNKTETTATKQPNEFGNIHCGCIRGVSHCYCIGSQKFNGIVSVYAVITFFYRSVVGCEKLIVRLFKVSRNHSQLPQCNENFQIKTIFKACSLTIFFWTSTEPLNTHAFLEFHARDNNSSSSSFKPYP